MAKAQTYKKSKIGWIPSKGETQPKETKVIPNESLSVRQMLMKHANGTLFDNAKTPFYEEQSSFSTKTMNVIQSMDLPEKLIFLAEVQNEAKVLETKVKTYQQQQIELAQNQAKANAESSVADEGTAKAD